MFVTFLIGPEPNPAKFVVRREFACYHSKVLNTAFNSNFIEGQTQTYRLEDTTPGTFKLLVQWLYMQKLKISQFTSPEQFGAVFGGANTESHGWLMLEPSDLEVVNPDPGGDFGLR